VCTLELREILRNFEVRSGYMQYIQILVSSSILKRCVFIFGAEFTFKSVKLLAICTLKYGANYFLTEITEITQSEIHCVQCTAHNAGMTFCKFTN